MNEWMGRNANKLCSKQRHVLCFSHKTYMTVIVDVICRFLTNFRRSRVFTKQSLVLLTFDREMLLLHAAATFTSNYFWLCLFSYIYPINIINSMKLVINIATG